MSTPSVEETGAVLIRDPADIIRSRAVRDANVFRALARRALRDGLPRGELRAANARAAARSVLHHARRVSSLCEFGL